MAEVEITDDDTLLERTFGWLFQDVHALLTRSFDRRVDHLELTRSQWRVLSPLLREDGITQTALADLVGIEKAPLGRTLDKLEKSGWIYRKADPNDRRARRVHLTDKLDPYIPEVLKASDALFGDVFRGFKSEDVEALMRYLMIIKGNITDVETKIRPQS